MFNNVTGVVFLCQTTAATTADLNIGNINACGPTPLWFISGNVRFAYNAVPTAAVAENPTGSALNLDMALAAPPATPASATCFDDSPLSAAVAASQASVSYYCAVTPDVNAQWSGTLVVAPLGFEASPAWTIADSGATALKVCRYTPTANDSSPNPDHPRTYISVTKAELLTNQNFLVIAAVDTCPVDSLADPSVGNFVNSNTRQHQPAP